MYIVQMMGVGDNNLLPQKVASYELIQITTHLKESFCENSGHTENG